MILGSMSPLLPVLLLVPLPVGSTNFTDVTNEISSTCNLECMHSILSITCTSNPSSSHLRAQIHTSNMVAKVTPFKDIRVLRHHIPAHGLIPNSSIQNKPLLIYQNAFSSPSISASQIESHLSSIGVVKPQWRYTMYSASHFHSTSHELLGISNGEARICFGHEDNPKKVEEILRKGDVVIIPAGVAHRLLEDLTGEFEMVGAYPVGCSWDMCYGKSGEEQKIEKIRSLSWFNKDPLYGDDGPAMDV